MGESHHLIKKCVYDGMRSRQILKKYGSKLHGMHAVTLDIWCRRYRKERDEVSSKRGKSPKLPQDVDDLIKHCVRHNIDYKDIYTVHEDKLQGMSKKTLQKLCEEYKNKEIEKKQMSLVAHTNCHGAKEADNDATATISINKKSRTNKRKNEVRRRSPQLPQDVYDLIKHCVRHDISYEDIFLCHEEKLQGMSQDSLRKLCKEYQNEKNEDHVSYLECAASNNDNDNEISGAQSISKNKKWSKRKKKYDSCKKGKIFKISRGNTSYDKK